MTNEEAAIMDFLKASPDVRFTRREIARKAVRRSVYEEDQHWVNVPLASLVARNLVEVDEASLYKYKRTY